MMEYTIKEVFKKEDTKTINLLFKYLKLLLKWHDIRNIVSSSNEQYIIKREIYDSYMLNNYLIGNSYTDIGSGGGLPGIIIAILNPSKKVTLIDRKTTFVDFLTIAKSELYLDNVDIIHRDVLKSQAHFVTDAVLLKNFSNKVISKMDFETKFTYLMKLIKKSKQVSKAYMLTGSPVLKLSEDCMNEFNVNIHEIFSPFFESNRVVAEVKFENTIDS